MTVVLEPVAGHKFRLYYRSSPQSRQVPRGNPLPFYDFERLRTREEAETDARRLQSYINREHE